MASASEPIPDMRPPLDRRRTALLAVGMGASHAWTFSVLMGRALLSTDMRAWGLETLHWGVFLVVSLAVWLFFALHPMSGRLARRLPLFSLAHLAGTLVMAIAANGSAGAWACAVGTTVGAAIAAFGSAGQIVCWSRHLEALRDERGVWTSVTLSFAIGGAASLGVLLAPACLRAACVTALPAVSAACSWLAVGRAGLGDALGREGRPQPRDVTSRGRRGDRMYLLLVAGYGLSFGALDATLRPYARPDSDAFTSLLTLVAALAFYLVVVRRKSDASFGELTLKSLATVAVAGVALVPVAGGAALFFAGFRLIDAVTWSLCSIRGDLADARLPGTFALGRLAASGGTFVGMLLAVAAVGRLGADGLSASIVSCCLLAVMIVATVVGLGPAGPGRDAGPGRGDEVVPEGPLADLEESDRRIAELFAQGRSARYIAERLSMSQSAVQARIQHVYRTVGVHTRQELIDRLRQR